MSVVTLNVHLILHNFWHFSKHHRLLSPLYITFALWGDQAMAFRVYFMEEARLKDTSEQSMCSLRPICGLDNASTLRTTALLYLLGPEHQCNTESFGRGIKATCRKETSFSIVPSNSGRRSWRKRPQSGRGSAVPAPALLWLLCGLREVTLPLWHPCPPQHEEDSLPALSLNRRRGRGPGKGAQDQAEWITDASAPKLSRVFSNPIHCWVQRLASINQCQKLALNTASIFSPISSATLFSVDMFHPSPTEPEEKRRGAGWR